MNETRGSRGIRAPRLASRGPVAGAAARNPRIARVAFSNERRSATARRSRLDAELVRRGLARSRAEAQELIAAGRVTVGGAPATKPASQVAPDDAVALTGAGRRWASRGGDKLAAALDLLGVGVAGRHALDAGAAAGGFTDVLLSRGAAGVVAVDVGYGQLDWRLRTDPRVTVLERTNVRHLTAADVPGPAPGLVVADLSFISLTVVLPALVGVAAADADFVLLVKPQFEAGRGAVQRGGVVRDPAAWEAALARVADAGAVHELDVAGACASPLPGPAGNVEFFLWLRAGADDRGPAALEDALRQGRALADGTAG